MNVLVLGRCMPNKKNSYGLFEFNQAKLLSQRLDGVCYAYVDNQSIRINRSIHSRNFVQEGVRCYGKSLPIGGLPKPSIEKIRSHELISLLNEVTIDGHQPDVIYAHFPLLTLTPRFVQELTTRGFGWYAWNIGLKSVKQSCLNGKHLFSSTSSPTPMLFAA